ncbi:helix-turn-helix domain-containing protein [Acinetobacter modestus]|uniref:helix-turn-helix domain-containing protein n=1 Tax=Acinetobacter modestus TaxID=1776740 RepID=UPI00301B5D26
MDWKNIIESLLEAKLSQKEIGLRANCSQNTIWMLLHEKTSNPSYATGKALIELYTEVCELKAVQCHQAAQEKSCRT